MDLAALSDQEADGVALPRLTRKESLILKLLLKRRLVLCPYAAEAVQLAG